MAQFIMARKGAVINLENIASVVHDADGFNSINGHTKSVTIHLVSNTSVTVLETDENYQLWLDFMAEANSLIDVMPSRHEINPEPDPWHHPAMNDLAEFDYS